MNKKNKVITISTSIILVVGLTATLGMYLSSCSRNGIDPNAKKVNVSSDINSEIKTAIQIYNISKPENNNTNIVYLTNVIRNCTSLQPSEYTIEYTNNSIKINISSNTNKVFSNQPTGTSLSSNKKTLTINNITWAEPIVNDFSSLLKKFNWTLIDIEELQDYIWNNDVFSSYIINNYAPYEIGIEQIIFSNILSKINDKDATRKLILNNYSFSVEFSQESDGYMVGTLVMTSRNYSYLFRTIDDPSERFSISDDGLSLIIKDLKFPTYVLENVNNEKINNNIQFIFNNKPIDTSTILDNSITDKVYQDILNNFGYVNGTGDTVVLFNKTENEEYDEANVNCNISIDNPNSITYYDFETPTTIVIDLNGSNIKPNIVSSDNIEYKDNKIYIHINAPVTPFDVEIQNPNISNDINNIINEYQIDNPDDLFNQYNTMTDIFQKINQSYLPESEGSDIYPPIDNFITRDEVDLTLNKSYVSNGVTYYNIQLEIKDNINKEFTKLNGVNINSIEIKDADSSKEHYKNKILIINNIRFYMSYKLIETNGLEAKINQAIKDLQIISYKDFKYYREEIFTKVFGNTLPSDKATVVFPNPNTIKITINEDWDYKFNSNGDHSKIFECQVNWFQKDYLVSDSTFNLLSQFIQNNNITKTTNINVFSQQLIPYIFGSNVYEDDVSIEFIPVDPNDYNNTQVQFKFNVKSDSHLSFILGELNAENAENVVINSDNELIITIDVNLAVLEIDSNIFIEQYRATLEQMSITNFNDTKRDAFKTTFATNLYNALAAANSSVATYINQAQFIEELKISLSPIYNSTTKQVTYNSSKENVKFLTVSSSGSSSLSKTIVINDIIF